MNKKLNKEIKIQEKFLKSILRSIKAEMLKENDFKDKIKRLYSLHAQLDSHHMQWWTLKNLRGDDDD